MSIDYKKLYEENADFKRYVDRHCATYGETVDRALNHMIVRIVGATYIEEND